MKSRCAIDEQTWRACAGVYWSSWKSVWILRPQTVWPGWSQNTCAPALNELFGNGVPVPVNGAWMPTLIGPALMPVVLPPCGVPHETLPAAALVAPPFVELPLVPPRLAPAEPVPGTVAPGATGPPGTVPLVPGLAALGPVPGSPTMPLLLAGPTPLAFSDAVASGLSPQAVVTRADTARATTRRRLLRVMGSPLRFVCCEAPGRADCPLP